MVTTTDGDDFDFDFDVFADGSWGLVERASVRTYLARRGARVNPRRATPFVSDFQSRSAFDTVKTGEWL